MSLRGGNKSLLGSKFQMASDVGGLWPQMLAIWEGEERERGEVVILTICVFYVIFFCLVLVTSTE